METILIISILVILSCIQSVFGVGILLFGTPTFILLGYPFIEVLGIVLPASLSLSLAQVIFNSKYIIERKKTALLVIPSLLLGIFFAVNLFNDLHLQTIIGSLLIIISLVRVNDFLSKKLSIFAQKAGNIFILLTSFIHGLTNMGGGFLTFYMAARFDKKEKISVNIAFIYALFALFQMSFLIITSNLKLGIFTLLYSLISISTFFIFGKTAFRMINQKTYSILITLIIF